MVYIIKKKLLSWSDTFNILDDNGSIVFTVVSDILSLVRTFKVFDINNSEVGLIKRKIISFLPTFSIEKNGAQVGYIKKLATAFKPKYEIDYRGYTIEGDLYGWDYLVKNNLGKIIAKVTKEHFHLTYTYKIEVLSNAKDIMDLILFIVAIYELQINDK